MANPKGDSAQPGRRSIAYPPAISTSDQTPTRRPLLSLPGTLNILKTSQAVTSKGFGRTSEASMAAVLTVLAASKDRQPCEAFADQMGRDYG